MPLSARRDMTQGIPISPALELTQAFGQGFWSAQAVRNGGFTFPNVGPVASALTRRNRAGLLGVGANGECWPANSSTHLDRWPELSMPTSPIALTTSRKSNGRDGT